MILHFSSDLVSAPEKRGRFAVTKITEENNAGSASLESSDGSSAVPKAGFENQTTAPGYSSDLLMNTISSVFTYFFYF